MALEQELLKALRTDERDALDEIIIRFSPYVSAIIKLHLGRFATPENVEELASNVFFALWRHRNRLKTDRLRGFLSAVAVNEARGFLRREKLRTVSSSDLVIVSDDMAFRLAQHGERKSFLRRALSELAPQDREILVRYYTESQPVSAIAKEMSLKPETVKSRLRRARLRLKRILEEKGDFDYEI